MKAEFAEGPGGTTVVSLSGSIDENADVKAVFEQLRGPATVNLQRVGRVNSMGVHRWIPLVTKFAAQHRTTIEEISYSLVQNANVVANLFGSAQVMSCMAPYYCGRCKANFTLRVTADEIAHTGGLAPERTCERCSSPLEFDELDGYFAFFKPRTRR